MALGKVILSLSVSIVILSVYLYRTIDKDTQIEYIVGSVARVLSMMPKLDNWLRYVHLDRLHYTIDAALANYKFNQLNTTGLIVGARKFDGVDVIVFDVLHHEKRRPAIVYIHGGGWAHFSAKFFSGVTADLARRLNTLVVSIDYRLAPLHTFPAAFDDVLSAVNYLFVNSVIFDIDPGRVALIGDSSGGNLAVAVAHHLSALKRRHRHGHTPKLIVPLSPILQIADMQLPSYRDNVHDIVLAKDMIAQGVCGYAFGMLSNSDLYECAQSIVANAHLDENTATIVKHNMDWTSHLKGKGYDNRPKSTFLHKPTKFTKRLSQFVLDSKFSPLSALNDTELRLLPPMYVFASSKDPLRDDAKLLVARMKSVDNIATYKEIDFHHDPYFFAVFGHKTGIMAVDQLEKIFKQNAIL